ncbi:hypothetical protein NE865_04831 [Phthorimaea operculella]|nr:hypothetical protein NE865_04831 [Phthorimaea operculella]
MDDESIQSGERWCTVVSAIFLLFTACRYCLRGFYRDLFGKSVINLCVSQAMGLLIFESMRYMPTDERAGCIVRGSLAYYFILVSFFWLNAICIQTVTANKKVADRLKTLAPKIFDLITYKVTVQEDCERAKKRRYNAYLKYAWCTPALFCVFMIAFVSIFFDDRVVNQYLLCDRVCKYRSAQVQWVFIYSGMLILTANNIYLFALDAQTFNEPGNLLSICDGENDGESEKLSDEEKEQPSGMMQMYDYWKEAPDFCLHLLFQAKQIYFIHRIVNCIQFRLFIAMTVPWLINMLISLMPASEALDVIQMLNNLRGVWIFLVLCLPWKKAGEVEENTICNSNTKSEEKEVENTVVECFKYEDV